MGVCGHVVSSCLCVRVGERGGGSIEVSDGHATI